MDGALVSPLPPRIVIFAGSSHKVPIAPLVARVSTSPWKIKELLPETSTLPPLPATVPPRAVILPKKRVVLSAQITAVPPLPRSIASSAIDESALTYVTSAFGTASIPCQPPPTRTVPPPLVPEALIFAPNSPTFSPKIFTVPPAIPSEANTFTEPETIALPAFTATVSPPVSTN